MPDVRYPGLYHSNTRVWLTELSRALGRAVLSVVDIVRTSRHN
jgi:hypothetical protein